MKNEVPRFSEKSISFLLKAGKQRSETWLERNQEEYEKVLLAPLRQLAAHAERELKALAPGYRFPQKGIGRVRRGPQSTGRGPFKSWMHYSASVPRKSRFEHNPNLYFLIDAEDRKGGVLVAGGLYMPSSQQLRALREAIAHDASAFERLFRSKDFARRFPGGFSDERISSRDPRGFPAGHPKMQWLRLQAFFVWRPYTRAEFKSARFAEIVAEDWKQILRLNRLLDEAIRGRKVRGAEGKGNSRLSERLDGLGIDQRPMDF